jgi:hypothetical protein
MSEIVEIPAEPSGLIYTTREDVEKYLGPDLVLPEGSPGNELIERCEHEIDQLMGNWIPSEETGRRLDPARLRYWELIALSRSVSAQVQWHLTVGEKRLIGLPEERGSLIEIKGPDFAKKYSPVPTDVATRQYGPNVRREMMIIGHLRQYGARARP